MFKSLIMFGTFWGGFYLLWHFGNGYIALGAFLLECNTALGQVE